jgi:hypothetical protein
VGDDGTRRAVVVDQRESAGGNSEGIDIIEFTQERGRDLRPDRVGDANGVDKKPCRRRNCALFLV